MSDKWSISLKSSDKDFYLLGKIILENIDTKPELSIIIPVKDEVDNIRYVARKLSDVFDKEQWLWECIWIDDGSTDNTLYELKYLAKTDKRHLFLSFEENAGKSAALWAGLKKSRGTIIATMDGDGQDDPSELPKFIEKIKSGQADLVTGHRKIRKDNLIRKLSSRIGNGFRRMITGKTIKDSGCAIKVFTRSIIDYLPLFSGMHRFISTIALMNGFKVIELPVNHHPRHSGKSKYNIQNRLWVGLVDCFGILWLKKRSFRYKIENQSTRLVKDRKSDAIFYSDSAKK
ncbi:MAG: glycosyltransferase family 2 protein [Desulfobacteraceae bacterium]|nr:glycosyltransferase family 2 protein [Desulfobacteraceae bacterium]